MTIIAQWCAIGHIQRTKSWGKSVNAKLLLVLVLLGLAILFIIQNVAVVEIQFLFWSMQLSRSLLMFLVLAVGILIGWFLHAFLKHRRAR